MYQILKKYKLTSLHLMVVILGLTGVFGKMISLEAIHLVWYRMGIACISLMVFLIFNICSNLILLIIRLANQEFKVRMALLIEVNLEL